MTMNVDEALRVIVTMGVEEALQGISKSRAEVDAADDYLRDVIRSVEATLSGLRPVELDVPYVVEGVVRKIQLRQYRGGWHIAWERGEEGSVALLSAPRAVRVEVFTETAWSDHVAMLAPMEVLVIAVSRELSMEANNRGPQINVARRLEAMVEAAARGQGRVRVDP